MKNTKACVNFIVSVNFNIYSHIIKNKKSKNINGPKITLTNDDQLYFFIIN